MLRKIIHIDEDKCTGCGACADACHEGAIGIVDGKAILLRESFCDGFGDCLPACPVDAIRFEEREAPAYDESAVLAAKAQKQAATHSCPGSQVRQLKKEVVTTPCVTTHIESELLQWPCQLRLVPTIAPYFEGARLLIAADCTAYAYANFHQDYMRGKVTLIACPKLDPVDYSEKLTTIFRDNNIQSVTILRMEVPCCGGLAATTTKAIESSGKSIPWQVITMGIDGSIIE